MKYLPGFLLLAIFVSGCAFSDAKIDVKYDSSTAKQGPLSTLDPLTIKVEEFKDERPYLDRIGDKKNGYGMDCADVVTVLPVSDVFRDGTIAMFEKNGHVVKDEDADIVISGVIERFWFDSQMNFWTIEFMGTADLSLEIKDAKTQQMLLQKRYSGHHNEELFSGYHKEMQLVMNETLEDMIENISMDSQLIEKLKSYSTQ